VNDQAHQLNSASGYARAEGWLRMKHHVKRFSGIGYAGRALIMFLCFLLGASHSHAAELRKETLDAWNQYVAASQQHMRDRADGASPFLWTDEDPGRAQRLIQGGMEVAPIINDGSKSVPHGLIHDWVGAVFIPKTSIDKVVGTVRDYDHYKQYFQPTVVDSRALAHSEQDDQYALRWVNKVLFVNAGVDAKCRTQYIRIDEHRRYATSYSTDLQEIVKYGESDEHDLAPDVGSGYVWRLYSFARYQERDGGVYVEIEALALTRDIPLSLRFLVSPEVKRLSRKSLSDSLQQTRAAVQGFTPAADNASAHDPAENRAPHVGSQNFKQH
jgi:hypothetical protein